MCFSLSIVTFIFLITLNKEQACLGSTGIADSDGYYKASSGGLSSAFGFVASGGNPSGGTEPGGGCGNSASEGTAYGGAGGFDGSAGGPTKGGNTCSVGRQGQGTTTREFGETNGQLYAGGGGGAVYSRKYRIVAGGSGIVIIRNKR